MNIKLRIKEHLNIYQISHLPAMLVLTLWGNRFFTFAYFILSIFGKKSMKLQRKTKGDMQK